ncbi:unnamed protein product, partial [Meganyctiphanes norvegica]
DCDVPTNQGQLHIFIYTKMSTNPDSPKSPIGEEVSPSRFYMSLVSDYGDSDSDDAIVETERHNIDKNLLPVFPIKEEVISDTESITAEHESMEYQNEKIDILPEPLHEENAENSKHSVTLNNETADSNCEIETKTENVSMEYQNAEIDFLSGNTNSFDPLHEKNTENSNHSVTINNETADSETNSNIECEIVENVAKEHHNANTNISSMSMPLHEKNAENSKHLVTINNETADSETNSNIECEIVENVAKEHQNANTNISSMNINSSEPLYKENTETSDYTVTVNSKTGDSELDAIWITVNSGTENTESDSDMESETAKTVSKEHQNANIDVSSRISNLSDPLTEENAENCNHSDTINSGTENIELDCDKEPETAKNVPKKYQNSKINKPSKITNTSNPSHEENSERYRYTVTIDSGTDDSQSDSEDSSSDGFSSSSDSSSSSSSDSDSEDSVKLTNGQMKEDDLNKNQPCTNGELLFSDLPRIEDLRISVDEDEAQPIGTIFSIVQLQVVVQAFQNIPPIDLDSILFLDNGKRALGKVFDVFGQVHEPLYTVRFNSNDHIEKYNVQIGDPVYFAPQTEHTQFVVIDELMKIKGSDASWEHNHEPPPKFVEYSDDEQEVKARQQRKQEKLQQEGISSSEFQPQRKRQFQGRKPNPFRENGSKPSRPQVRATQRQRPNPWAPRPNPWAQQSGPSDSRAMSPFVPAPQGADSGPSYMGHHQNADRFAPYDQWSGEYQFGAPPQFPQAGPGPNWHDNYPRNPMGPTRNNNGPPSYMGPPPTHRGPSHMSHMGPPGENMSSFPPHMHHFPPPHHPAAPMSNYSQPYSSQGEWFPTPPPPPGIFVPPPPPPHP